MWQNVLALRQISQRAISTASRRQYANRVSEQQKLFQADNGLPVHLKGGAKDSLLYKTTAGVAMFEAELIPFEDASATNISLSSSHVTVTVVAAYYKQLA